MMMNINTIKIITQMSIYSYVRNQRYYPRAITPKFDGYNNFKSNKFSLFFAIDMSMPYLLKNPPNPAKELCRM